ncbi:hypothetical protein [Chitinophaga defluvii]|uniref:Uncharacterized protein n=1 Tax=Chitinophaga defluvii TaxID=3163343 RepID=A0ABV2TCE1_9BACT
MIELPYSFKDILLTVAVLLVIYYGYVILRYYREELSAFFKGKAPSHADDQEEEVEVIDPFERYYKPVTEQPIENENYILAEELILRIKEAILDAGDQQTEEAEVLSTLQLLVQEYPTLKDEILRAGISEMIISEMKIHGFIGPSRSEVDGLWKVALG